MLHGKGLVLLREVEHIENDGLRTAVLAVVDSVHHFHDWLTLVYHLSLAVLPDDGQLALYQYAVITIITLVALPSLTAIRGPYMP